MELSPNQLAQLSKRFPQFELSYETISHRKVSSAYNLALAIPAGKKMMAWFTFHYDKDVCYFLDLTREKKISRAQVAKFTIDPLLAQGTILYGTWTESVFVIEDIYYYKGVSMRHFSLQEQLEVLEECMCSLPPHLFRLPLLWSVTIEDQHECPTTIPADIGALLGYPAHHIQYRALEQKMPYLNVNLNRKPVASPGATVAMPLLPIAPPMDLSKPQYKFTTVFRVMADMQFDIYHLYAYGKQQTPVYFNIAYVPNYRSSVFLNGIFRRIRENRNLDYIEESDDEEDFQNINPEKYVDLNKEVLMECVFHPKFKRWVPLRIADERAKVIHISRLVRTNM